MKYQAVIFDMGGTLIRGSSWSEVVDDIHAMVKVLGAPEEEFVRLCMDESNGLNTGAFPSFLAFVRFVCTKLKLNVSDDNMARAADIPFNHTKRIVMIPRAGAMEVLSSLKSAGYKIGLISDCDPDLPMIWPETPFAPFFDSKIFSFCAGMTKADPKIFLLAVNELGVKPSDCLYIADGMRNELANATAIGMHAVQIFIPEEIDESPNREEWHGDTISSLKEILPLLGE